METKIPVKKLFKLALFTSTAIGLITIAPVYVMTFSIAEALAGKNGQIDHPIAN